MEYYLNGNYNNVLHESAKFSLKPSFKSVSDRYPEYRKYEYLVYEAEVILKDNGKKLKIGKVSNVISHVLQIIINILTVNVGAGTVFDIGFVGVQKILDPKIDTVLKLGIGKVKSISLGEFMFTSFLMLMLSYLINIISRYVTDVISFKKAEKSCDEITTYMEQLRDGTNDKKLKKKCNDIISQSGKIKDELKGNSNKSLEENNMEDNIMYDLFNENDMIDDDELDDEEEEGTVKEELQDMLEDVISICGDIPVSELLESVESIYENKFTDKMSDLKKKVKNKVKNKKRRKNCSSTGRRKKPLKEMLDEIEDNPEDDDEDDSLDEVFDFM